MCNVAKAVMIEWNKLGFVICERSLYMQIFNLDRSYLLLSFNLITLSSLALLSKSFLFTPYSFYEGFQDLDSMARNIQYFHPEPETTVSCRSWAPQSSSPSLARWLFLGTSLPHFCWCFSKLAPCSHPGKLLLSIPLLSLSLIFFFLSHSPHPSHCFSSHRLHNMKNLRFRKNNT